MFNFMCKILLRSKNGYPIGAQNSSMAVSSSSSLRYFSIDANPHSFTVSYLVKKCGLSPESALSLSKNVQFKTSDKPELVRSTMKKLGFSKTQISEIIRKFPRTLSCNPEKVISPKFEFFRSRGASTADTVSIFTLYPWILRRSLENHLIPSFNYFRDLFQSDEKAIAAVKRFPRVLFVRLEAHLVPNINTLRDNGVPVANILVLIQYQPRQIEMNSTKFGAIVNEVRKMGFNPVKSQFVRAITVLAGLSKSSRDQKFAVYRRWGWSKRVTVSAFKRSPCCLAISEAKIMAVMDFYVNQLGLDSSVLAHRPKLLSLSLEKRLIPRAAVLQFLSSKGMVKLDSKKTTCLFEYTEKYFLEKFVNCHEEAPHLLKLYNDKLNC